MKFRTIWSWSNKEFWQIERKDWADYRRITATTTTEIIGGMYGVIKLKSLKNAILTLTHYYSRKGYDQHHPFSINQCKTILADCFYLLLYPVLPYLQHLHAAHRSRNKRQPTLLCNQQVGQQTHFIPKIKPNYKSTHSPPPQGILKTVTARACDIMISIKFILCSTNTNSRTHLNSSKQNNSYISTRIACQENLNLVKFKLEFGTRLKIDKQNYLSLKPEI